jgi:hypothetical protein
VVVVGVVPLIEGFWGTTATGTAAAAAAVGVEEDDIILL